MDDADHRPPSSGHREDLPPCPLDGSPKRPVGTYLMAPLRAHRASTRVGLIMTGRSQADHLSVAEWDHYATMVVLAYRQGRSIRNLAALTGLSYTTVRRMLVRKRVVLRPPGPLARSTPRQPSTSAALEEVDLAKALSRALAEVVMGDTDRHELADRIEVVAAGLVSSLRQTPTIVEAVV